MTDAKYRCIWRRVAHRRLREATGKARVPRRGLPDTFRSVIERGTTSPYLWKVIAAVVAAATALGLVVVAAWPYLPSFTDPERVRSLVAGAGAWSPVVYILLQVVQVLIAPIPGQVVSFAGGLLFGTWWGVAYTMVGATIGFTAIFVLTRRLGRPFVERFVSARVLERFDYLDGTGGALALFIIYLLPGFPDDVISFIAGLTRIRLRTLILISLGGRLPGYFLLSATASGTTYENLNPMIVLAAVTLVLGAVGYWKRHFLHEMVKSGDMPGFIRQRRTLSPAASVMLFTGVALTGVVLYLLATAEPIQIQPVAVTD